jgi:hypothetical protein
MTGTTQLVLAHYQEDLRWLCEQDWDQVIIYAKGARRPALDVDLPVILLPNIGRETHTYLHHIVSHYDDLADITIFSQADIADHLVDVDEVRIASLAREAATARQHGMTGFGLKYRFRDWDGVQYKLKWAEDVKSGALGRAGLTPGEFYEWVFGEKPPPSIPFYAGAILGVHRRAVLARPQSFYRRLLEHFEGSAHANPEESHYMERFWVAVFDPDWAKRALSDSDLARGFR